MKSRLIVITILGVGLALLLVYAVAAQGVEIRAQTQSNPDAVRLTLDCSGCGSGESLSYHPDSSITQVLTAYLPIVQHDLPPCFEAPTLISPTNGSNLDNLIPEFTYQRGTYPVTYTMIAISDDPAFSAPIQYYSYGGGPGPTLVRLFRNLTPAITYYWRTQDNCGPIYSPYSTVFTFTTGSSGVILPAPTLISPISGTVGVGQEVTVTWSSVTGAVGYQLWYGPLGEGHYLDFLYTNSIVIQYLQPNKTYEWYVDAYNDYAYGDQSEVWHFTTGTFTSLLEDLMNFRLGLPYVLYQPSEQPIYIIEQTP